MNKKDEALKLALEALELSNVNHWWGSSSIEKAITAIREALAEQPAQQQEPVAWMHWLHGPVRLFLNKDEAQMELERLNREYPVDADDRKMRPLVFGDTSPPASKPWVGLTDEEIETAMPSGIYDCLADPWDCGVGDGDEMRSIKNDVVRIARAIEAELREKNEGKA